MQRLSGIQRAIGGLLALVVVVEVVALFWLSLPVEGDVHVSIAGLEAAVLCWAATARTATFAASRTAGVLCLIIAALLASGVRADLSVSVPSFLGPDLDANTVLLAAAGFTGLVAGLLGAAAHTAVQGEPGRGREAALVVALFPIALDLWSSLKLLGDAGQSGLGLAFAILLALAAGGWLVEALRTLRAPADDAATVPPAEPAAI